MPQRYTNHTINTTLQNSNLYFQEGNSDKVYFVSLGEVEESPNSQRPPNGQNRYVVNFSYGRRGKWLQRGTKTPNPTSRYAAQIVFDDLVKSKLAKGYIQR